MRDDRNQPGVLDRDGAGLRPPAAFGPTERERESTRPARAASDEHAPGAYEHHVNPPLGARLRALSLDRRYVRGEGTVLRDAQGAAVLDFVAGFGALPFGHNHPDLVRAARAFWSSNEPNLVQMSDLHAAGNLAERLLALAPAGFERVCFANSGAEAVEAALKAALAATGRRRILATLGGFHGKTLGALSATGRPHLQAPFGTPFDNFAFVPFGDTDALDAALAARDVAAFIVEPVQGEGGVVTPPPGYLAAARRACTETGTAFVLDEVQTGFARTGTMFACEAEAGILPDALVLSKALGGGIAPIGAVLLNGTLTSDAFAMLHSSTFAANAFACRVALAVLDLFEANRATILANVAARGAQLADLHAQLARRFPHVLGAPRGRGLMLGLEFVVDARTFSGRPGRMLSLLAEQDDLVPLLASYLLARGIRTAPTIGRGGVMRVQPPLIVNSAECARYGAAMGDAVALLARGDTAGLCAHLTPGDRGMPIGHARVERPAVAIAAPADAGRFAFLLHALGPESFVGFDRGLATLSHGDLQALGARIGRHIQPFPIGQCRIDSPTGAAAHGEFIAIAMNAREMMDDRATAEQLVLRAVDLARDRGAKIVGLGGFTSIIMRGGQRARGRGVAITTGNSYTVVSAIEAVEQACTRLGLDLRTARVGIVGASGSIGAAAARLIAARVGSLVLFGNPDNPHRSQRRLAKVAIDAVRAAAQTPQGRFGERVLALIASGQAPDDEAGAARLVDRLMQLPAAVLGLSLDLAADVPDCDVLVSATSSTEPLLIPTMLKPGAVICDLSRPSNTSPHVIAERPDVLVLDGGVVEVPGRPYLGVDFGFPSGLSFACMAETMMFALERRYEDASIGSDLSDAGLELVARLGQRHGFRLAGLRCFDEPLETFDWQRARRARAAAPRATAIPGGSIWSNPACGCVAGHDMLNITTRLLDRHLATRPDAIALSHGERVVSYAALAALTARAARALDRAGVSARSRVALLAHDTPEAIAIVLATMRRGAMIAYCNPFARDGQLADLLDQCDPDHVLVAGELHSEVAPVLRTRRFSVATIEAAFAQGDAGELAPAVPVPAATLACCHFSSGATGRPKAVAHSHRDIANTNSCYFDAILDLRADDVLFSASKAFFVYGFNAVIAALHRGAHAVLTPPAFKPDALLDTMAGRKVTVFFGVPTVYMLALARATSDWSGSLPAVRAFVSAGEALPEDVAAAWHARFGHRPIDGIGATETMCTFISATPDAYRSGATGRVVPGFDVKLVTEDDSLARPGEIGVSWVRGVTIAERYFGGDAPAASNFDGEWFCTNDMFHVDDDGWFHFAGRANDVIKVGGCWVWPAEIETVLRTHPAVREVAVVAAPGLGKLLRPRAVVVLADGYKPGAGLGDDIRRFVRARLLPQQYPHFIDFVDALPRTASGKVQRHLLSRAALPVGEAR
jgi:acetylornithine/succinyldiaminopimelate/putrescine aminotransferase/acyl-coenzyme A synthetase/AMP-(fatty) acid ligase/predicted amino acid dehydrogenase